MLLYHFTSCIYCNILKYIYHDKVLLLKYSPHQTLQVTHKTVHIAFACCLVDYVLVVIVSQSTTQFLIVHFGFVLADSPTACHLIRICQLELPAITRPGNEALA
jgi:hypothetical protein